MGLEGEEGVFSHTGGGALVGEFGRGFGMLGEGVGEAGGKSQDDKEANDGVLHEKAAGMAAVGRGKNFHRTPPLSPETD